MTKPKPKETKTEKPKMRRLKFIGAAIMALLSLAAITAATASAAATAPNVLPEASAEEPITFTGSSGKTKFGNGVLSIKSEKSVSLSTQNSLKLGTFDVLYEETKDTLGSTCTGLNTGETAGSILVLGTFHIVDYKVGTELKVGVTFLIKPVHFSCGATLLIVHGCVAAGINTPVNTLSKTLVFGLTQKSGDNEIIKVLNAENEKEESCELTASEGGGAFKLSSQEQEQVNLGFKKGSTAEEILVMPL
jgi:hypothetical protein